MDNDQNFRKNNSLDKRIQLSKDILNKYPDKIPIILESKGLELKKYKFIVNKSSEFSYFLMIIRKFVNLKADQAIFLFVKNNIPSSNETIGSIYQKHKDGDGFLYFNITTESTFGDFRIPSKIIL
jgi:GABA(A) receptor-associated protein